MAIHGQPLLRKLLRFGFAQTGGACHQVLPILKRRLFACFQDLGAQGRPHAFETVKFCHMGLVDLKRLCAHGHQREARSHPQGAKARRHQLKALKDQALAKVAMYWVTPVCTSAKTWSQPLARKWVRSAWV